MSIPTEDEFSWSDPGDSLVIDRVDPIAVYTNPKGAIVIRQQDPLGGIQHAEDPCIVVPRDRVNDLIAALKREAEK